MVKYEAIKKGWLSETIRILKKSCSELLFDRNFHHGEASSGAVSLLVGLFYNSKFGYNGKFDSYELGTYRITIVFSVWIGDPVKHWKHQYESHLTDG